MRRPRECSLVFPLSVAITTLSIFPLAIIIPTAPDPQFHIPWWLDSPLISLGSLMSVSITSIASAAIPLILPFLALLTLTVFLLSLLFAIPVFVVAIPVPMPIALMVSLPLSVTILIPLSMSITVPLFLVSIFGHMPGYFILDILDQLAGFSLHLFAIPDNR